MLTRTQLKQLFAENDFRPLKRLGENYLIDANIKDKIIASSRAASTDTILEIGPGFGALTIDLASSGAKIYAVEKDKKACSILGRMAGNAYPNLHLINRDILGFDIDEISCGGRVKIVGNLPYYITTPVIEYIIENKDLVEFALVMVQREFASRLMAAPGSRERSSISCFVQYHARPEYIHTVKRTSFFPSPDVDSSLIRLDLSGPAPVEVEDERLFFRMIRGAFNQKRKSVINSLSRKEVLGISKETLAALLDKAGIDPNRRPESLSLADFANISNIIGKADYVRKVQ